MIVSEEIIEALGISRSAMDEIVGILGRMPTEEELSTLLAMWESNGKQQSLYGWLKGQHHMVEKNDYLYNNNDDEHRSILEPKIRECVEIAKSLHSFHKSDEELLSSSEMEKLQEVSSEFSSTHALLIYMVGKVSMDFLDSEYARKYLHLTSHPQSFPSHEEEQAYTEMILDALEENNVIVLRGTVGRGGLFEALVTLTKMMTKVKNQAKTTVTAYGFDILTCREVRLDAFLFGEEPGRYIVALEETQDDLFLQKLDEARVDACFLGRTTKGRILVDGYDFGSSLEY